LNLHDPSLVFAGSPIHGIGAFAGVDLPCGTRVTEYVGEKITRAESLHRCEQNNPFIFRLDDTWDIDGSCDSNPARFLNHSCAPNCEAQFGEGRVWIVAVRDIRAGEEITFNYGFDLEDYREHPCHCGSPECVGFIVAEAFFDHVRKQCA
jgi:SET domain-containing protein